MYFLTVCLFLVLFTVQVPTVPEEATIVRTLGKILPSAHGLRHAGGGLVSSQCFSGRSNDAFIFLTPIERNRILYCHYAVEVLPLCVEFVFPQCVSEATLLPSLSELYWQL